MSKIKLHNIREMTIDDLEIVFKWRNHPDVRRYMYTQHEISLSEHKKWFEKNNEDYKRQLLIFEIEANPVGFVNVYEIAIGGIAEWGFYVAPDASKGAGTLLARAALEFCFMKVKLHKLCGKVLAGNMRSIHLHEKLAFKQEGVLREQHFDGKDYHDIVCFGLLSSEWESKG